MAVDFSVCFVRFLWQCYNSQSVDYQWNVYKLPLEFFCFSALSCACSSDICWAWDFFAFTMVDIEDLWRKHDEMTCQCTWCEPYASMPNYHTTTHSSPGASAQSHHAAWLISVSCRRTSTPTCGCPLSLPFHNPCIWCCHVNWHWRSQCKVNLGGTWGSVSARFITRCLINPHPPDPVQKMSLQQFHHCDQ